MRILRNHLLKGEGVTVLEAHPSWYLALETLGTPERVPLGCLWHWTDTLPGSAKRMALKRVSPRGDQRAASWHVTIAQDGSIWQMVPFHKGAYHAGKGRRYRAHGVDVSPNYALVGIELEGRGDEYTDKQVASAQAVLAALVLRYGWDREDCIHEHRDFDPARRRDCGPPWTDKYLPQILSNISF